ncbi:MAG: glycosyltransferase [Acetobacteraceae bacterium]|nr:glycosyltransferase [Acetobacteraceae bacterium]
MRILHVIAGAEIGGAETFAVDAITALAERGVAQHVICRPFPLPMQRYAAAGIGTTTLRFAAWDHLLHAGIVAREARRFGADLVQAWMSRAGSFIPAHLPCPAIGWFGDYYKLKYFAHCDAFFGVTPDIAASIVQRGMPAARVFTTNTFGTMPDTPPVSRASLNTPADAIVALVLSRMHRVKGIDTLLEAAARVPGLFVWLAGDGPELETYRALATALGLAGRVRFLGWRNDRKSLLQAADICVLPSRYEPFGTVIVEAWAAGRPLVATSADGARQYVRHDQDGLLSPIEDVPALAANLARLLAEPALGPRLAAAGSARYAADFTREIVIDRLIETYRHVLALGKRPRAG